MTEKKDLLTVDIVPSEETIHSELAEDQSLAPTPEIIRQELVTESDEHSRLNHLKELHPNISELLSQDVESDPSIKWRIGEDELSRVNRSLDETLSNLEPRSETQIFETSYNISRWLADALEEQEESLSTSFGWKELTRGITKKAHTLLYVKSKPEEILAATSAIRDLQTAVDLSGLQHYSLSSKYPYDKDQTTKISFGVENQVFKDFSKLSQRLDWDKTQGMVFALCLGLTKSDALQGKAIHDRLKNHAQRGLKELEVAWMVGSRQYKSMLDHVANKELTREKQQRIFRQLRNTHTKSNVNIPPRKFWADMWYRAVVDPPPQDGRDAIGISVYDSDYDW